MDNLKGSRLANLNSGRQPDHFNSIGTELTKTFYWKLSWKFCKTFQNLPKLNANQISGTLTLNLRQYWRRSIINLRQYWRRFTILSRLKIVPNLWDMSSDMDWSWMVLKSNIAGNPPFRRIGSPKKWIWDFFWPRNWWLTPINPSLNGHNDKVVSLW